jgi:hypothetical protein
MGKRCLSSLESWSQIDVPWDNTSIKETVHSILDVVLSDRRRVREGIVSEVLWQDALSGEYFAGAHSSYS